MHDVFSGGGGSAVKTVRNLKEEGKAVLTDAVLFFLLPCNIINSFRMEFDLQILKNSRWCSAFPLLVQVVSYCLSKTLYNRKPAEVKRVMQYCTIVSNSGFLGLPIAEGIFGAEGMMYASIFIIIPMRVMMWSAGIACFTESPDFRSVAKRSRCTPVSWRCTSAWA